MSAAVPLPPAARVYVAAVAVLGAAPLVYCLSAWRAENPLWFALFLIFTLPAAHLRVVLPGVPGSLSVVYVLVLIAIAEFSFPEAVVLAALGMLAQSLLLKRTRPRLVQTTFNVAAFTASSALAWLAGRGIAGLVSWVELPLALAAATLTLFFFNTASIAGIIGLTGNRPALAVWRETYLWTFPLYFAGAAVAAGVHASSAALGWQTTLLVFPVLYLIYRSYHLHVSRIEEERRRAIEQQKHAEEMNALHLRTVEALALAIEAKDHTTHSHLERVQVYALEIGRELGLPGEEMEALRAASLLHDIGKLAVPEYIISKPGKLTPEEFERMKVHPVVGAEILEQVRFPYPVVPVVRSHHEKWDGSGYPDGLAGETIPMGARILAAVDCLDALANDRQYRRALPLEQAIEIVKKESGKAFDPRVVEVLARRYVELEQMAKAAGSSEDRPKLSIDLKIERGLSPAAGFESAGDLARLHQSITAGSTPSALGLLLSQLAASDGLAPLDSLAAILPFDSLAVYRLGGNQLLCLHAGGPLRDFVAASVPLGAGLSGWVAENGKPILNGNPAVEPGYETAPGRFGGLQSALAVPIRAGSSTIGVLALYSAERDGFNRRQLAWLEQVAAVLTPALETATAIQ